MFESKQEKEMRKQAEERRAQIARQAAYRNGLRDINNNQNALRNVIEDTRRKAIAAENNGDHAQAVRYAAQVRNLETQAAASGSMKNTVEAAHAMSENAAALNRIMTTAGGLMDDIGGMIDPDALYRAQYGVELAREQLEANAEYCSDFLNDGFAGETERPDPVGEAALMKILNENKSSDRLKMLDDTNSRLDAVRRARAADKT